MEGGDPGPRGASKVAIHIISPHYHGKRAVPREDAFSSETTKATRFRVFWDDDCLPIGKPMEGQLIWASRASKVAIPVISPHYVKSVWCLRENAFSSETTKATCIYPFSTRSTPTKFGIHMATLRELCKKLEGFRVFWDDDCLPIGKPMEGQLIWASRAYKVAIPVISPHYAESVWCLREDAFSSKTTKATRISPFSTRSTPTKFGIHMATLRELYAS
ncbi:hypothetical protein NL676_013214 [Syzygium grande]|nr:hypothetical protein NL676_013214 [Syzygium grande]